MEQGGACRASFALHFACGETALAGHRPHRGRYFAVPVTAAPRRGPNGKTPALVAVRLHFAYAKPRWPVVAPTGGNVLAAPFSLCSNVAPHIPTGSAGVRSFVPRLAPHIPAGSAGVRSFVPRLAPRSHPGAYRRSAPFRCAKPRWPVVAPAGGNVLATPFSLCSNVAPRSHPGAQLRFILKQLYASGCPFLRNFPFFSSVPHPFFASAPGRTDTQKSAAGIPRRGFNTFSVSWLYFPLPNT